MNFWLLFSIFFVHLIFFSDPVFAKNPRLVRSVKVRQTEQVVTSDHFRKAMIQEFNKRYSLKDVNLNIKVLSLQKPVAVPQGQLKIQMTGDPLGVRTGRRAFRFSLHVDSRMVKTVNVVAEVTAEADVVTPVRWIKPHEIVRSDDIRSVKVKLPSLGHDFVRHPTHAIGKKAIRPLPPNQPLRQSFLSVPPLIHSGDRVIIEARRGGLLVQTVGTAKASGQLGQMIPVVNQTSGREVSGVVLGAGIVEVQF